MHSAERKFSMMYVNKTETTVMDITSSSKIFFKRIEHPCNYIYTQHTDWSNGAIKTGNRLEFVVKSTWDPLLFHKILI